ncbi:predicted protein [Nematostella vectensis]|uniref:BHLH domain-containing protein n=1 Tax=Nematostella vectensis TaxID=45351 RepID=A7RMR1_NEMVE|nr:uncharacterized protein LOC5519487 isoform X2 [Nematostella vectensis]EDO47312.1 predicted protein [Nematostella vectensis]|eukprot:XP_001639375.1 predicted protein [Nematostella vectensis]
MPRSFLVKRGKNEEEIVPDGQQNDVKVKTEVLIEDAERHAAPTAKNWYIKYHPAVSHLIPAKRCDILQHANGGSCYLCSCPYRPLPHTTPSEGCIKYAPGVPMAVHVQDTNGNVCYCSMCQHKVAQQVACNCPSCLQLRHSMVTRNILLEQHQVAKAPMCCSVVHCNQAIELQPTYHPLCHCEQCAQRQNIITKETGAHVYHVHNRTHVHISSESFSRTEEGKPDNKLNGEVDRNANITNATFGNSVKDHDTAKERLKRRVMQDNSGEKRFKQDNINNVNMEEELDSKPERVATKDSTNENEKDASLKIEGVLVQDEHESVADDEEIDVCEEIKTSPAGKSVETSFENKSCRSEASSPLSTETEKSVIKARRGRGGRGRRYNTRHVNSKTKSYDSDFVNPTDSEWKQEKDVCGEVSKNRQKTKLNRLLANEHERRRVAQLNGAYQDLRQLIPGYQCDTKLPKIKILRYAINYIAHLDNILSDDN